MLARRGRRGDGAKTHMLEIMVMLSIMVAAVANVLTFEVSTSSFSPEQADLQDAAEHFLAILDDTPHGTTSACDGSTWLSQVAIEALAGDQDFFDERLSTLLDNKEVNLLLDNGRGKYPLITQFAGNANAGAAVDFTPDATWALPIPQVSGVAGQEALVIDTPAIQDSEMVGMRGEAIEAELTVRSAQGTLARPVYAHGVTSLPRADYLRSAVQDILWTDPANETATLFRSPSGTELAPIRDPMRFRAWLVAAPGFDGVIPTSTDLNIVLPTGWTFTGETSNDWSNISEGDEAQGWRITFTTTANIPSPAEFSFRARAPLAPTRPFDVIQAQLGNGSLGQSPFIVQYTAPTERGLPQSLYLTTPYPLTPGADATFGVVYANGGTATTVKYLDITIPGGYDLRHNDGQGAALFAEVTPTALNNTSPDGSWSWVDAKHLRWSGSREVPNGTAAHWIFKARITSDNVGNYTAFEEPASDGVVSRLVMDNDFDATSITLGPNVGVLRQRISPDSALTATSDGYPWSVAGSATEHEYLVRVEDGSFHVDATGTYTVVPDASDLVQMDSAIANSTTRVTERLVPLGGVARIETNVESMVTDLAANGITDSSMTVDIYSPFSRGCTPTATWTRDAASMPLAAVHDVDVYDELGLGSPSTYLAGDDRHVYRVDATGSPVWSRELAAAALVLDAGATGPLTSAVFAGDASGAVTKLDLALGTVSWEKDVEPGNALGAKVLSIEANATNGQVLVVTETAIEILSQSDGATLGRFAVSDLEDRIVNAEWIHSSGVAFMTKAGPYRASALLADPVSFGGVDGFGLSVGRGIIIASHGRSTTSYDVDTLEAVGGVSQDAGLSFTATGDATGDGVPDHLVAFQNLTVKIYNGVTGAETVRSPPIVTLGEIGLHPDIPNYFNPDPIVDENPTNDPTLWEFTSDCENAGDIPTLQGSVICVDPTHPGNSAPVPLELHAYGGRVLFTYMLGPVPRVYGWSEPTGAPFVEDWYLDPGHTPSATWIGPWNTIEPAFGWGTSAGKAGIWGATTFSQKWYGDITDFVGRFVFQVGIPMGGFYGAHIVKMTLAWEDPTEGAREAHLIDWFHVVDVDGTPVAAPHYRIELNIRDPFAPMDRP